MTTSPGGSQADRSGATVDSAEPAPEDLLALPVALRYQLLAGWVFCLSPAANTAGPSGVGGQALTLCGSCDGCRLGEALRCLAPLDKRPTTCAKCGRPIAAVRLTEAGEPVYVHTATNLFDCDPTAPCGPYATPITN